MYFSSCALDLPIKTGLPTWRYLSAGKLDSALGHSHWLFPFLRVCSLPFPEHLLAIDNISQVLLAERPPDLVIPDLCGHWLSWLCTDSKSENHWLYEYNPGLKNPWVFFIELHKVLVHVGGGVQKLICMECLLMIGHVIFLMVRKHFLVMGKGK